MLTLKKIFFLTQCFCCCVFILLLREVLDDSTNTIVSIKQNEFSNLMSERISILSKHCENQTSRPTIKSGEQLYLLWNKRLVWCPVYKAASTNWMHHMLYLSGLKEEDIEELRYYDQILF